MTIQDMLDEMQRKALRNAEIRTALLETKDMPDPLRSFCEVCRKEGYEIYPMDVVNAGEEFYASMRRSTNGGGENAPMLDGEDDFYELFLTSIR